MTEDALKAAFMEARRAAEFGFTATEYNRYKANYISQLDKQYSNKDKRYNSQFVNRYVQHFLANEPIPSIDYTYSTMKQVVPMLPLEVINELYKELIPANDTNMVVLNFNTEKDGAVYPTADGFKKAISEARAAQLEAYVDNVKDEPLMANLPTPGKITKEVKNDKFGYTELTLSNGATVILKQTDLKKDQVLLSGEGFGGSALYGAADFANIKMFDNVIEASGLGNFSHTELEKAMAGKVASISLSLGTNRQHVSGSSTPKDVEAMLQLMYLTFTNINKDQQSFDNLMQTTEMELKNRSMQPEVVFSDSLVATVSCHNSRNMPLVSADLANVSYDRILQMAKERTANAAAYTFTLIGNYDEATIRPLIEQYIASLPAEKKVVKSQDVSTDFKGVVINNFKNKAETPKAIAVMVWHTKQIPYTLENDIKASIAGQVLQMVYLKKIREDASAAYTVVAQGNADRNDFTNEVQLLAYCPMKPEKGDIAVEILRSEVEALANTCDADMLTKVKEYMLKNVDDQAKTNGYWAGVISDWRKWGLDMHTDFKAVVQAQTPESISAFVKEMLKAGNRAEIVMMPAE